jgi:tetratricopeptide (TPR) repeat protein
MMNPCTKIALAAVIHFFLSASLAAQSTAAASRPATAPSPAERALAAARLGAEKAPQRARAHNAVALALLRRARETADAADYDRALEVLRTSFALEPGNYEAERLRVWALLGKHDFATALGFATALQKRAPDDVLVYGFITDAQAELGDYRAAEAACQWMLDIRPGAIAGLTRAAYLREMFGDVDGAIDLMNQAYHETHPAEVEDRAWILTHIAHLEISRGRIDSAEPMLASAVALFPDYHYALAQMAAVRTAQGRASEAVDILAKRLAAAPHPENRYDLALALSRAGRAADAARELAEFERTALLESSGTDNCNKELIFYWCDQAKKPRAALELARAEAKNRSDVRTLHAYAWALLCAGEPEEALDVVHRVLAVGVQDAVIFYHAGVIARRAGDLAAAARYLRSSLALHPHSVVAPLARAALDALPRVEGAGAVGR